MQAGPQRTRAPGRWGRARIGTSGYQYDHWRRRFYPSALPKRCWFEHYAAHFDTVEINASFYRLPAAAVFDAWREAAPAGFCFALKFSRYGSHLKKLADPERTLALFLERARRLRDRLGPVLVQLPPHWGPDPERLAGFLAAAPKDVRFAFEFRDAGWLCEPVFELLRANGAALCVHDLLPRHPREPTADWCYLRFHGTRSGGCYTPRFLSAEARRIASDLARGRDVYAYFNNDLGGHAVANALALRRALARLADSRPARRRRADSR
jgi:uncharacterized protein YecE (DUF72 family)